MKVMVKQKTGFMKVTSVLMSVALSIGVLAGCSANDAAKDTDAKIEISVGNWPDKEGVELDDYNLRKARFEEANPDVSIKPDIWFFDRQTFYAKAAGGQLPTVFKSGYTEIPEIIDSEYAADISGVLKKRGYDGMLNENILNTVGDENGKIFAFPASSYILGLAINTELFQQAGLMEEDGTPKQPEDWNEMVEFATKIKEKTGKSGIVFPTANKVGGWIFTPVAWSYGVQFMEKDENDKWKAKFNTPECVEALSFIKDLKWKYDVLPANSLVDYSEMYKAFATGDAGMLIAAGDSANGVVQYGMTPDQLGMVALPKGPKRHVTLLGGESYCVKEGATEEQIDAAVRWLETAYSYQLTDEYKENKTREVEKALADGKLVGIMNMSPWSENAESQNWLNQLYEEKANANLNHVKLYNKFVLDCPAEIQPEEPVCAQELYEILDRCIQEVLTNENADCKELIAKAASEFQTNYLDKLTY